LAQVIGLAASAPGSIPPVPCQTMPAEHSTVPASSDTVPDVAVLPQPSPAILLSTKKEEEKSVVSVGGTKPKKKKTKSAQLTDAFLAAWREWRTAGGRLSTTQEKTFDAWGKALEYLGVEELDLLARIGRFVGSTESRYIPDLAVALNGPKKGCQFTDDGLGSREVQHEAKAAADPNAHCDPWAPTLEPGYWE